MKSETHKNTIEEQNLSLSCDERAWELKERKITFFFNLGIKFFLLGITILLLLFWCYVSLGTSSWSVLISAFGVLAFAFRYSLSAILVKDSKADEQPRPKSLMRFYFEKKIMEGQKGNTDKLAQISSSRFLET
jgi:hypothetical protein